MNFKALLMIPRLALLSAVAISCVEHVKFDTGNEAPLVVHCILTESDVQELDIRLATSYGTNNEVLPDDITAELKDNRIERTYRFRQTDGTHWTVDMRPEYGETYDLSIRVSGKEVIHARTIFPRDIKVMQFMKRRKGEILTNLYYSCELRIPFTDSRGYRPLEGAAYDGQANLWIFPKEGSFIGTTHPYADDFNLDIKTVGDLACFSRDSMMTWSMFMNESKRWMKDSYQGLRLHDGVVRINSPEMFDNGEDPASISSTPLYTTRSFILLADFPSNCYPSEGHFFDIRIVSDELDLYLKDVYQKEINRGRDMRIIYDHDNSYTNMSGGLGIFGAMLYRTEGYAYRGYNDDFYPDEE